MTDSPDYFTVVYRDGSTSLMTASNAALAAEGLQFLDKIGEGQEFAVAYIIRLGPASGDMPQ